MSDRAFEILICTLAALAAALVLLIAAFRSRCERAAYLEGRYNLDRATAWQLVEDK